MIELSSSDLNKFLELRKSLHRHPELGYSEIMTTESIKNFLALHGVPFTPFEDMTGSYALIDAGKESTFGFRCDIDALPLSEQTGVEFASQTHGVMHACGHDMHMTIGAALSVQLFRHKDKLSRNVVVLFQPAEECNPRGGAASVIKTGFLQKLNIAEMYGLHVWPSLPVGTIALRPGPLMGASDHFRIEVHGRKSHAAEPHNGVDAILIAAQIYTALVHRLRREISPFTGSLVSIGTFRSEGRYNVICTMSHWKARCARPTQPAAITPESAFPNWHPRSLKWNVVAPKCSSTADTASSRTTSGCTNSFQPVPFRFSATNMSSPMSRRR